MRLDYTLYILAALFFVITAVSLVIQLEQTQKSLWVVTTVVLGLMSIGVGYYQRPKAQVQTCQPAVPIPQPTTSQTLPAIPVAAPVEEKTEAPTESPPVMEVTPVAVTPVAEVAPPVPRKLRLNRIQGVGEKRVAQLKALGINNLNELAKASADDIAKSLQISPKMTKRWIATAEELTK